MPSHSNAYLSILLSPPALVPDRVPRDERDLSLSEDCQDSPSPSPSLKSHLNTPLPGQLRVTGRTELPRKYNSDSVWCSHFLLLPSLHSIYLPRFLAAGCWEPLRKSQWTCAGWPWAASPRSLGCKVDVCTRQQNDTFQVPLTQGAHRDQLHEHSSSKNTSGTSDHPFPYCSCWQVSTNLLTLSAPSFYLTVPHPVGAVSSKISHVEMADRKTGVISKNIYVTQTPKFGFKNYLGV